MPLLELQNVLNDIVVTDSLRLGCARNAPTPIENQGGYPHGRPSPTSSRIDFNVTMDARYAKERQ
jgi:hypothetical protein